MLPPEQKCSLMARSMTAHARIVIERLKKYAEKVAAAECIDNAHNL